MRRDRTVARDVAQATAAGTAMAQGDVSRLGFRGEGAEERVAGWEDSLRWAQPAVDARAQRIESRLPRGRSMSQRSPTATSCSAAVSLTSGMTPDNRWANAQRTSTPGW